MSEKNIYNDGGTVNVAEQPLMDMPPQARVLNIDPQAADTYKVDERRRSLRTAARYKGRIEIQGYAFPVVTWDLSMGGARCSVQGVFPSNTLCTLYLEDDEGGKAIGLPCRAVRSSGFDTRLRFTDLNTKHKDFLTALTSKFGS